MAVARSYSQERAGRDLKNRPQVESAREKKKREAKNNMEKTAGGRNGTKEDVLDGSRVLSKEEERVAESCPWPIPSIGSPKARRRRTYQKLMKSVEKQL